MLCVEVKTIETFALIKCKWDFMVYIGHMLQVQLHRSAFLQICTGSVSQWELLSIVVVAVLLVC